MDVDDSLAQSLFQMLTQASAAIALVPIWMASRPEKIHHISIITLLHTPYEFPQRSVYSLNYPIVLLSVTTGVLLISLLLPWLVVSLFGQRSFTALDNMQLLAKGGKERTGADRGGGEIVMSDLISVYPNSSSAFLLSMAVLYPASILAAIISVFFAVWSRKKTGKLVSLLPTVALAAGILATATGLVWIYSIESFKSQFSRDAEMLGGIVGEEWKGKADLFVNNLIFVGMGQYFVIAAGVIAIFSYLIHRSQLKQERNQTLNTTDF